MSDDKIAEIRERYAGYSLNSGNAGKANEDRGWLLAEVDRRGAEIAALRAKIDRFRRNEREYDAAIGTAAAILPGTGQKYAFSFPLRGMQMVVEQFKAQRAEIEKLRAALTSIASNTCCNGCQEAARVARDALEGKP